MRRAPYTHEVGVESRLYEFEGERHDFVHFNTHVLLQDGSYSTWNARWRRAFRQPQREISDPAVADMITSLEDAEGVGGLAVVTTTFIVALDSRVYPTAESVAGWRDDIAPSVEEPLTEIVESKIVCDGVGYNYRTLVIAGQ